jgi:hypothetical protein
MHPRDTVTARNLLQGAPANGAPRYELHKHSTAVRSPLCAMRGRGRGEEGGGVSQVERVLTSPSCVARSECALATPQPPPPHTPPPHTNAQALHEILAWALVSSQQSDLAGKGSAEGRGRRQELLHRHDRTTAITGGRTTPQQTPPAGPMPHSNSTTKFSAQTPGAPTATSLTARLRFRVFRRALQMPPPPSQRPLRVLDGHLSSFRHFNTGPEEDCPITPPFSEETV